MSQQDLNFVAQFLRDNFTEVSFLSSNIEKWLQHL